jgi:hypothetical protein
MTTRPDPGRRIARLARLPILVGPIVLAMCWSVLAVVANAQHAACWGGFNLTNIAGPLSLDYRLYGNVGPALPLLMYAAMALSPYLLLYAAGLIALRSRATTIVFAISVFGTALVALCYCLGYATAYADLASGGFLCDLGFELIPFGGLIAAVLVIVLGSFIGWLIQRRTDEVATR